jgi:hypothetical protein
MNEYFSLNMGDELERIPILLNHLLVARRPNALKGPVLSNFLSPI